MLSLLLLTVKSESYDSQGLEFEDETHRVLTGTSYLQKSDCVIPASCKIINGGKTYYESSFRGSNGKLKSLSFQPSSQLSKIYPYVFQEHSLTKLDFGNCEQFLIIEEYLCQGCSNLVTLILPPNCQQIKTYAFKGCSKLEEVIVPNSVKIMEAYAFQYCYSLTKFTINTDSSFEEIQPDSLSNCPITYIFLPKNLSEIYGAALLGTKLTQIEIHRENKVLSFVNNSLLKNKSELIFALQSVEGEYRVPSTVTTISSSAIRNTLYTSIILHDKITSIGNWALGANDHITKIEFPEGLKTIPTSCLRSCSNLQTVVLSSTITEIREKAFLDCSSLTTINLIEGITTIGPEAFKNCKSLKNLIIPSSLTNLEAGAFTNCKNLEINCSKNEIIQIENGMLFVNGKTQLNEYFGSNTKITIPSYCTCLGSSVFVGTSVTEVSFNNPETLTIMDSAFLGTKIEKITFPNGLSEIGEKCFSKCQKIEEIDLSNTMVTVIPFEAFSQCPLLKTFNPPMNLQHIKIRAFYNNYNLTNFDFKNTKLEIVGDDAFVNCILTTIEFPNTIQNLSSNSFMNTKVETLKFSTDSNTESSQSRKQLSTTNVITNLPYRCFYQCSYLHEVVFPDLLTNIEEECFRGCIALEEIILPQTIECINIRAFYGCKKLNHVEFSKNCNLESIRGQSFGDCPKLTELYIDEDDEKFKFQNGVLLDKSGASIYLYLPSSQNKVYLVPAKITSIKPYAFQMCTNLVEVYIPDGNLREINIMAFNECSNLKILYLADSLEMIGDNAFLGCTNIKCVITNLNKTMKAAVVSQGIPNNVFREFCPRIDKTCQYLRRKNTVGALILGSLVLNKNK